MFRKWTSFVYLCLAVFQLLTGDFIFLRNEQVYCIAMCLGRLLFGELGIFWVPVPLVYTIRRGVWAEYFRHRLHAHSWCIVCYRFSASSGVMLNSSVLFNKVYLVSNKVAGVNVGSEIIISCTCNWCIYIINRCLIQESTWLCATGEW